MRCLLLACLALTCTALFVACGSGPKDPPTVSVPAKKTWTREEFRKLVMGKMEKEVIEAVGKPDTTRDVGGESHWFYNRITIDPISEKTDSSAQLVFKNGVVDRVNY